MTFTTTSVFSCSANGGGNITSNQKILAPTDCTNTTYAIKRTVRPTVTNNRGGNSQFYKKRTKYNIYYYCKKNIEKYTTHSVIKDILEELVLEQLKLQDKDITRLSDELLNKFVQYICI